MLSRFTPQVDNGANVIKGSRSIQLLLYFNNDYNPSPASARTVLTNIETTTGIVHKIDGLLIDGCAQSAITNGLYGDFIKGRFSILDCQCAGGNPFPLACSPSAVACPLDDNHNATDADHWPWRTGIADGWKRRCSCPVRPWDTAFVDFDDNADGEGSTASSRKQVPWHSLSEELLEEELQVDQQWAVTQLFAEWGGFRRILMAASEGSPALETLLAAELQHGVV